LCSRLQYVLLSQYSEHLCLQGSPSTPDATPQPPKWLDLLLDQTMICATGRHGPTKLLRQLFQAGLGLPQLELTTSQRWSDRDLRTREQKTRALKVQLARAHTVCSLAQSRSRSFRICVTRSAEGVTNKKAFGGSFVVAVCSTSTPAASGGGRALLSPGLCGCRAAASHSASSLIKHPVEQVFLATIRTSCNYACLQVDKMWGRPLEW
jgi:hypothetical protein